MSHCHPGQEPLAFWAFLHVICDVRLSGTGLATVSPNPRPRTRSYPAHLADRRCRWPLRLLVCFENVFLSLTHWLLLLPCMHFITCHSLVTSHQKSAACQLGVACVPALPCLSSQCPSRTNVCGLRLCQEADLNCRVETLDIFAPGAYKSAPPHAVRDRHP